MLEPTALGSFLLRTPAFTRSPPVTVPTTPSPSEDFVVVQREVQRKLGRCLIRLQQYEMLLKSLVAVQEIAGTLSELPGIVPRQQSALSKKTLGHVVGLMTDNYLAPPLSPDNEPKDEDDSTAPNESWFAVRFQIELPAKKHERAVADLAALVSLRNELVHHFLENQDIWTEAGCVEANAYLVSCYQQIDERYEELRAWANSSLAARQAMADILGTPEVRDCLEHGILPGGGVVFWDSATIVELLRNAELRLAQNGWTLLNEAIDFIQAERREHTPKRYGCSSWRQVLHDSGLFLIRKVQTERGLPTQTWYQSRKPPDFDA